MHLSYLQYQLHFHGIRRIRMRNSGNCRFTSWRIFDPQARTEPDTLYLMTARQFQALEQPVNAVCIPDYPAERGTSAPKRPVHELRPQQARLLQPDPGIVF